MWDSLQKPLTCVFSAPIVVSLKLYLSAMNVEGSEGGDPVQVYGFQYPPLPMFHPYPHDYGTGVRVMYTAKLSPEMLDNLPVQVRNIVNQNGLELPSINVVFQTDRETLGG